VHLSAKLLTGDLGVNRLLAPKGNPFYNLSTLGSLPKVVPANAASTSVLDAVQDVALGRRVLDMSMSLQGKVSEDVQEHLRRFHAPRFVRAMLYEYEYAPASSDAKAQDWEVGRWYRRRPVGVYMPAISHASPAVKQFLQAHHLIA
jgi:hypothetical protein